MPNFLTAGKAIVGSLATKDGTELSNTELAYIDGLTAGTVSASKAIVVNSSLAIDTWVPTTTTSEGVSISRTTGTTGDLVKIVDNGTDTGSRNVLNVVQDNAAATGAVPVNVQQDAAATAVKVDQNADAAAVVVDTEATTANGVDIAADTFTTGTVLDISDADALTTGGVINVTSDSADTGSRNLVLVANDNTAAVNAVSVKVQQDAAATGVLLDQNGATGAALRIDQDSNDTGQVYAVAIESTNAGTGAAGGIDLSTLSTDEPVLNVPSDSISTAGAIAHRIPVNINGVGIKYVYAYEHGT